MTTEKKTKRRWTTPLRVAAHINDLLIDNENLRIQIKSFDEQVTRDGLAIRKVIAENEELRARLRSSEATAQQHYRAAQEQQARINNLEKVAARHHREANDLKAQLRAADETAGKALADAKRARDSQGVVWLVRFTSPSALPYVSFVAATKDDALLKISRIYLKTKVLDSGARVQVFNNDAEGAFAGEYIIQQAKIVNPG